MYVLCRCFLSDETRGIATIIRNILQCALDFRSCVTGSTWETGPEKSDSSSKVSRISISQVNFQLLLHFIIWHIHGHKKIVSSLYVNPPTRKKENKLKLLYCGHSYDSHEFYMTYRKSHSYQIVAFDFQVLALKGTFDRNIRELHLCYLNSPRHGEFSISRFWDYVNYNDYYTEVVGKEMGHRAFFS